MFWYNLKIAIRHFTSQKNISLLNLLGLSIGMSIAILIFYFVNFEMSYDNFHKESNLIYRIISVEKGTQGPDIYAFAPLPLPQTVKTDIKDVEMVTALTGILREDDPVHIANQTYFNLTGYTTDTNFLRIFNFPMISGDPNTVFDDPGSVVITQSTAKRLFGEENPLGKVLKVNLSDFNFNFTVAGILKDLPENSVFKFNLLASHLILKKIHPDLSRLWWYGGSMTFIKTNQNQNVASIKTGLASIPDKYFPDFLKGRESFDLQQLKNMHLDNNVYGDRIPPISLKYLYILLAIAFGVLFIACTNFINLSTYQLEKRAREAGIRKLSGGGRSQIAGLFIYESIAISLIASVVAVFIAEFFLPWFNYLSLRNLTINFANSKIIIYLVLFGIFTGALSGLYPALLFSGSKPVNMFRPASIASGNKIGFRKGFIVIQFLITILLIIIQLFMTKQVLFMKNHDLGFNKEDLLSVPLNYNDENKRLAFSKLFKESLEREADNYGIKGFTVSENIPGQNFPNRFAVIPEGQSPDKSEEMVVTSIDSHFSEVFQVPVVNGRNLNDTLSSDKNRNVLINETAAHKFGWENPLGKQARFKHEKESFTIVGVLKDINFKSLQSPIEPVVYRYAGENWLTDYITIRISHSNYKQTINYIKATWGKLVSDIPFQHFFIKDKYADMYKDEERLAKTVGSFALIAVVLSCLGLFAFISFLAIRRTKEIGIHKINGAKVSQILTMLNKDFLIMITISYMISIPVSWVIIYKWLQIFAYKTEISWWIFALAGIIALGIVLLTVSWQSWRAATRNPVEALRYE